MFFIEDLTVLIVTYRTNHKILENCLKSINNQSKILIVENSSDKAFKNKLETKYSNLEVVLSGKNLGYGGGNNLGINLVKTNYVIICNPDVVFTEKYFLNLQEYINNKLDFDIIGPSYKDTTWNSFGYFEEFKKKNSYISENSSLIPADWVVGCNMLIDLKKFTNKNIFDEKIFLYWEEFDLCFRTLSSGGKVFGSKNLIIEHLGHKGSAATDPNYSIETEMFRNWHFMWSSFYFYKKHFGFFYSIKKNFGKLLRSIIKLFYYSIFYNKKEFTRYYARCSGLINSIIGKKSWYRVKSLFQ